MFTGKPILSQYVSCLAGLTELVIYADLLELAVDLAHEDLGHSVAQTADDAMLLYGDYLAALLRVKTPYNKKKQAIRSELPALLLIYLSNGFIVGNSNTSRMD